jgi:hypothetical protein
MWKAAFSNRPNKISIRLPLGATELRSVKGVRRVEFILNQGDPSQYGGIMLFRDQADLDNYKEEQTGKYQTLVRQIRETWVDQFEASHRADLRST